MTSVSHTQNYLFSLLAKDLIGNVPPEDFESTVFRKYCTKHGVAYNWDSLYRMVVGYNVLYVPIDRSEAIAKLSMMYDADWPRAGSQHHSMISAMNRSYFPFDSEDFHTIILMKARDQKVEWVKRGGNTSI